MTSKASARAAVLLECALKAGLSLTSSVKDGMVRIIVENTEGTRSADEGGSFEEGFTKALESWQLA